MHLGLPLQQYTAEPPYKLLVELQVECKIISLGDLKVVHINFFLII